METITCLWIQNELDEMSSICIKSWIKLGYNVDLYTYSNNFINNISKTHLHIKEAKTILDIGIDEQENQHPPFLADIWRFTFFKNNIENDSKRVLWLDTDILLLKRIPITKNFVSSQYTQQNGAFKCKNKVIANIGVICMDGTENIDYNKILNCKGKDTTFQSRHLKEWEKQLKEQNDLVADPESFCPVHWAWAKDFFTERFFKTQTKYGILQKQIEDIIDNENHIYGVHLWRQLYKKKKLQYNECSIYKQLLNKLDL